MPSVPRLPLQESTEKVVLAVTVALATVTAVLGHWLSRADPIVWIYYPLLVVLGGYLLVRTHRKTTPVLGALVSLIGLAVLGYGVAFDNVISSLPVATPALPLDPSIHLGDGFTLRLTTSKYTYIVRTPAAILGYLLFVTGLYGTDFEDPQDRE